MNPPIKNEKGEKLTRRYAGVFPPKNTADKKAFKAYQKGEEYFLFGRDNLGRPQKYLVPQEFKYT